VWAALELHVGCSSASCGRPKVAHLWLHPAEPKGRALAELQLGPTSATRTGGRQPSVKLERAPKAPPDRPLSIGPSLSLTHLYSQPPAANLPRPVAQAELRPSSAGRPLPTARPPLGRLPKQTAQRRTYKLTAALAGLPVPPAARGWPKSGLISLDLQ